MTQSPNKITGPNAGGPRQFPIRTPLAARVGLALGEMIPPPTKPSWSIREILWFPVAVVVLAVLFTAFAPRVWPPVWLERRAQRRAAVEDVLGVGGWQPLTTNCAALFKEANLERELAWRRGWELPPGLSALRPQMVEIGRDSDAVPAVYIKLNGGHHTGGRDTPDYGIIVRCDARSAESKPKIVSIKCYNPIGWVSVGWHHRTRGRLADSVFEVY
jgi:hypothetical protein